MATARRFANLFAVLAAAAGFFPWSAATTTVPDTPVHPGAWTTRSRKEGQEKTSIENSHLRLEEQASRETRETFGEDFCQQLENEQAAVRAANEGRARISREEAGCSPSSPLSSPSLGSLAVPGDGHEATIGRNTQDGPAGPTIGDWLR